MACKLQNLSLVTKIEDIPSASEGPLVLWFDPEQGDPNYNTGPFAGGRVRMIQTHTIDQPFVGSALLGHNNEIGPFGWYLVPLQL